MSRFSRSIRLSALFLSVLSGLFIVLQKVDGQDSSRDEQQAVSVKLPESFDDVEIGGAGRYLLFQLQTLNKIAVFDVEVKKITHYIATPDSDCKFAAGLTKLVIVNGQGTVVSRYDLATGERELANTINLPGPPTVVLFGNASQGPVIVHAGERNAASSIELRTLAQSPMRIEGNGGFGFRANARISANGKTITNWGGGSPSGLKSYCLVGEIWKSYYEHTSVGAILPSADGKTLFTAAGMYTKHLRPLGHRSMQGSNRMTLTVPAVHGSFYLRASAPRGSRRGQENDSTVTLHVLGDDRALAKIENLSSPLQEDDQWGRSTLSLEKRLIFLPRANLIAQVSNARNEILLHPFNVDEALEKSDVEFLFVNSQAPIEATAGQPFRYQIDARGRGNRLSFSLDAGPSGMNISESGLVTWQPKVSSPQQTSVIVTISDETGQEIFHAFDLKVAGGTGSQDTSVAAQGFSTDLTRPSPVPPLTSQDAEKVVELPSLISNMVVGAGGRLVMLHFRDLKKVAVFDVAQARIIKYLPANDDQTLIAAGANHLLIVSQDQGVITRYNLTTLQRELTRTIPFSGAIKYIGMGCNSFGPAMVRWSETAGQLDTAHFAFVDLKTLDEAKIRFADNDRIHSVYRDGNEIHATSNGKAFVIEGIGVFRLSGDNVSRVVNRSANRNGSLIPSCDGRYFVTHNQILNSKLLPVKPADNAQGLIVPSITGQFYLQFLGVSGGFRNPAFTDNGDAGDRRMTAKLFLFGDSRPLVAVDNVPAPIISGSSPAEYPLWKRVVFLPEYKVIVSASTAGDAIVIQRLDIDEALKSSGVDYLVVTSTPPEFAKLDRSYEYQLEVKSRNGDVEYQVDSGPSGMTISQKGKITWTPDRELTTAEQKVIVTIKDASEQEVFHTFTVQVPEVEELIKERARKEQAAQRKIQLAQRLESDKKRISELEQVAADRRQQIIIEVMQRETRTNPADGSDKQSYSIEDWTDSTGQHTVRARFVEVEDKTRVVLETEQGVRRAVSLSKLADQDIYRAVQYDLQKRGVIKNQSANSPFAGMGKPERPAGAVPDKLLLEIVSNVERMIKVAKVEKDAERFLRKLLHPDSLSKMQAREMQRFREEFELAPYQILEILLTIDYASGKLESEGSVTFRAKNKATFKKHDGVWYMYH